jgi:hypothetical protein
MRAIILCLKGSAIQNFCPLQYYYYYKTRITVLKLHNLKQELVQLKRDTEHTV